MMKLVKKLEGIKFIRLNSEAIVGHFSMKLTLGYVQCDKQMLDVLLHLLQKHSKHIRLTYVGLFCLENDIQSI